MKFKHTWAVLVVLVASLLLAPWALPDKAQGAVTCEKIGLGGYDQTCWGAITLKATPSEVEWGKAVHFDVTIQDSDWVINTMGLDTTHITAFIGLCPEQDISRDWCQNNTRLVSQPIVNGQGLSADVLISDPALKPSGADKVKTPVIIATLSLARVDQKDKTDPTKNFNVVLRAPAVPITIDYPQNANQVGFNVQLYKDDYDTATSQVIKKYNYIYNDGNGTLKASSIKVTCGKDKEQPSSPAGSDFFVCQYDKNAATYQGKIIAYDSSGKEIASQTFDVTVTGKESNQGLGGKPDPSLSDALIGIINTIISAILGFISEVIFTVFYWLIAPLIQSILSIHTYTDAFAGIIYPGWEVTRNVCNIFFIIALIIIAMATLFRVESYQFRHLLVQLVIAALLINFSLVIGQAVLGLADTVQSQFLPDNVGVIRSLARDMMVGYRGTLISNNGAVSQAASQGFFTNTVQQLFLLALSMGSFMVFLAIAAFLVIRIVMLWVLLMISPIAYAAGVLPTTSQYRSQWWSTFLKYAFFTPFMAFFLNLAAVISSAQQQNPILKQLATGTSGVSGLGDVGFANFVVQVGSNVMILVFLVAALMVSEKLGIYGAETASKIAKGGMFIPFAGAKALGGRLFEGVQNSTGLTLDPRLWAKAYKEYSEREKHKRLEKRADQDIGFSLFGKQFRIKDSAKMGLGSPMDFYKNYANWQGVKRMGRNWRMRTSTALHKMNDRKAELDDLRQEANIMTVEDVKKLDISIKDANDKYDGLLNAAKDLLNKKNIIRLELNALETKPAASLTEDEKKRMDALGKQLSEKDRQLEKLGAKKFNENPDGTEVLLEDFAQDSPLKEAQVMAKDLQSKKDDDKEKLKTLSDKRGVKVSRKKDDADKAVLLGAITDAQTAYNKAQGAYYSRRLPEAYHARAARQSLEAEEEKKVSDIKNWPEKVQVFLTAQAEQNPYLAAATIKSLAKDSNFNEIVEALGYSSSAEGLKQFFEKEYRDKFNLTDHQMMQVATEVGYVNEDAGWWNMARISDIDGHGHLNWSIDTSKNGRWASYVQKKEGSKVNIAAMSDEAREKFLRDYKASISVKADGDDTESDLKWAPQNNEIAVEMEKRGPRLIANFARTSFVNQTLGPEGHVSTGVHAAARGVMKSLSKTQNLIYEYARMLRPNTAKAIASAPDWSWEFCKRNRIDREIYEKITKMAGKPLDPLT